MKGYKHGADILGLGVTDFVPWLGTVGKIVGGLGGSNTPAAPTAAQQAATAQAAAAQQQLAMQQAIDRAHAQAVAEQAAASAKTTQMLMFGMFGAVVLGGAYLVLSKKGDGR